MAGLFHTQKEREQRDELLSAYLDGQLSARERARLEARLASDPALRAELETLRHTVALVRSLPIVPVPRNFILPRAMVVRLRPARLVHPRYVWAAPLLTAATAVVSLILVVVLAGDLLLSGMGGLAFAPGAPAAAPLEAPQKPPQLAVEVTRVVEAAPTESAEVEVEAEKVAPAGPTEAPLQAAPPPAAETQAYAALATPAPTPSPPPPGEEGVVPTSPPGLPAVAEATPLPAVPAEAVPPSPAPAEATLVPTVPATATVLRAEDVGATPGEVAAAPPPAVEEEAPRAVGGGQGVPEGEGAGRAGVPPCRVLEVLLGLTALGLALATVRAWRARRR